MASAPSATSPHLPAGRHRWELTAGLPVPLAPSVLGTESLPGGAIVHASPVATAIGYTAEISADGAATWQPCGSAPQPLFKLDGLTNGAKYHVRITAHNAEQKSDPGPEYPIYVTDQAPLPPDGLFVGLAQGSATITWGEVLGATEYRLYRRGKSENGFRVVYAGLQRRWKDVDAAIVASAVSPVNTVPSREALVACEYYVTTVSHNGEGNASRHVDTNPASWRNWNPTDDEQFRRVLEQRTPNMLPNDGGQKHYPR